MNTSEDYDPESKHRILADAISELMDWHTYLRTELVAEKRCKQVMAVMDALSHWQTQITTPTKTYQRPKSQRY